MAIKASLLLLSVIQSRIRLIGRFWLIHRSFSLNKPLKWCLLPVNINWLQLTILFIEFWLIVKFFRFLFTTKWDHSFFLLPYFCFLDLNIVYDRVRSLLKYLHQTNSSSTWPVITFWSPAQSFILCEPRFLNRTVSSKEIWLELLWVVSCLLNKHQISVLFFLKSSITCFSVTGSKRCRAVFNFLLSQINFRQFVLLEHRRTNVDIQPWKIMGSSNRCALRFLMASRWLLSLNSSILQVSDLWSNDGLNIISVVTDIECDIYSHDLFQVDIIPCCQLIQLL